MSVDIQLPNITASSTDGQVKQLSSYMYQLVDKLNYALNTMNGSGSSGDYQVLVKNASGNDVITEDTREQFEKLKDLIIKSADIVEAYEEKMSLNFNSKYAALSDYGEFKRTASQNIALNADNIDILQEETQEITTNVNILSGDVEDLSGDVDELQTYVMNTDFYLKTGKLEDTVPPVYGVEIGQTTTVQSEPIFQKVARFTPAGIYFYLPGQFDDNPVAYMTASKLYIPNGNITGGTIDATNINVIGLEVGSNVTMGANATISWNKVTDQPSIPSKTSDLNNDSDYQTGTEVENTVTGKGYQTAQQVTTITQNTVTTSYVNALNVTAANISADSTISNHFTCSNLDITGGTVNITTNASAASAIALTHQDDTTQIRDNLYLAPGSVGIYKRNTPYNLLETAGITSDSFKLNYGTLTAANPISEFNQSQGTGSIILRNATTTNRLYIDPSKFEIKTGCAITSSTDGNNLVSISASGYNLYNSSGYQLIKLEPNTGLTFYSGTSPNVVTASYPSNPSPTVKYLSIYITNEANFEEVYYPFMQNCSSFVLQVVQKTTPTSDNDRVLCSTTIFRDMAEHTTSASESCICLFPEDPTIYRAECYFNFTTNKIYIKAMGHSLGYAKLYGVI